MRMLLAALFALAGVMVFSASGPAEAASECKSLESKTSCSRRDECVWVDSYKTKKGTKVSAYCRAKGGKGAKKAAAKKPSTKKTVAKKTTDKKTVKKTTAKTSTKASDSKAKTSAKTPKKKVVKKKKPEDEAKTKAKKKTTKK